MKQIITIEIEEEESKRYDYATLIMLALYDRKEKLMSMITYENEEKIKKIVIECEKLIKATEYTKVERR